MNGRRASLGTFGLHLTLTAACVTGVFALLAAATLFVPLFTRLDESALSPDAKGEIAGYVLHLHRSFWPVVLGSMIASVASGMLLFQRMRAPLVRFVRVYADLAGGRSPEPLTIRGRDYLQEETEALNRMIEAQDARRAALHDELERLGEILASPEPALDDAVEAIERMRKQIG